MNRNDAMKCLKESNMVFTTISGNKNKKPTNNAKSSPTNFSLTTSEAAIVTTDFSSSSQSMSIVTKKKHREGGPLLRQQSRSAAVASSVLSSVNAPTFNSEVTSYFKSLHQPASSSTTSKKLIDEHHDEDMDDVRSLDGAAAQGEGRKRNDNVDAQSHYSLHHCGLNNLMSSPGAAATTIPSMANNLQVSENNAISSSVLQRNHNAAASPTASSKMETVKEGKVLQKHITWEDDHIHHPYPSTSSTVTITPTKTLFHQQKEKNVVSDPQCVAKNETVVQKKLTTTSVAIFAEAEKVEEAMQNNVSLSPPDIRKGEAGTQRREGDAHVDLTGRSTTKMLTTTQVVQPAEIEKLRARTGTERQTYNKGEEEEGPRDLVSVLGPEYAIMYQSSLNSSENFKTLNKVQCRCAPILLHTDENLVISAPTGCGKTLLLELAMLRLFRKRLFPTMVESDDLQENIATDSLAQSIDPPQQNLAPTGNIPQQSKRSSGQQIFAAKAVYICPIKALAQEKYQQWQKKFCGENKQPGGDSLKIILETGDQQTAFDNEGDLQQVLQADIIITTPERWDSITRRWKEGAALGIVSCVGLLLLDEVHLVSESRGAALEAIVSRMKAVKAALPVDRPSSRLRFVAVSATIPNANDIGTWLHVKPKHGLLEFDSAQRPIPLQIFVMSYPSNCRNPFSYDRFLTYKVASLIKQYSQGKPSLIFCSSRAEVKRTAEQVAEDFRKFHPRVDGQSLKQRMSEQAFYNIVSRIEETSLKTSVLQARVGYHHAALSFHDRQIVEEMFILNELLAVCTTTTLAVGVNLPAHLVIIKGTDFFKGGVREDMSMNDVSQMAGRAGRPQFDTDGVALILTTEASKPKYELLEIQSKQINENRKNGDTSKSVPAMPSSLVQLESQLHEHMVEHVNAEIALQTINHTRAAPEWLKTTFLWVRLMQNPKYYGLQDLNNAEEFATTLMKQILTSLVKEKCCALILPNSDEEAENDNLMGEEKNGKGSDEGQDTFHGNKEGFLGATRIGHLMAKYYIDFGTICVWNECLQPHLQFMKQFKQTAAEKKNNANSSSTSNPTTNAATEENVQDDDPKNKKEQKEATTVVPPPPFTFISVLKMICKATEFHESCRIRQGDKHHLNELNKQLKYPLYSGTKAAGREVKDPWQKAFVLIQAVLGAAKLGSGFSSAPQGGTNNQQNNPAQHGRQVPFPGWVSIEDFSLRNDVMRMWTVVPRLVKAFFEFTTHLEIFPAMKHGHLLLRCVEQKMWADSPMMLRQLEGVSDTMAKNLYPGGVTMPLNVTHPSLLSGGGGDPTDAVKRLSPFEVLVETDARKLEALCNRHPPFGSELIVKGLNLLPRYTIHLEPAAAIFSSSSIHNNANELSSIPQQQKQKGHFILELRINTQFLQFASGKLMTSSAASSGVKPAYLTLLIGNPYTDELYLNRRFAIPSIHQSCQSATRKLNNNTEGRNNNDNDTNSSSLSSDDEKVFKFPFSVPNPETFCQLRYKQGDCVRLDIALFHQRFVGLDCHRTFIPPFYEEFERRLNFEREKSLHVQKLLLAGNPPTNNAGSYSMSSSTANHHKNSVPPGSTHQASTARASTTSKKSQQQRGAHRVKPPQNCSIMMQNQQNANNEEEDLDNGPILEHNQGERDKEYHQHPSFLNDENVPPFPTSMPTSITTFVHQDQEQALLKNETLQEHGEAEEDQSPLTPRAAKRRRYDEVIQQQRRNQGRNVTATATGFGLKPVDLSNENYVNCNKNFSATTLTSGTGYYEAPSSFFPQEDCIPPGSEQQPMGSADDCRLAVMKQMKQDFSFSGRKDDNKRNRNDYNDDGNDDQDDDGELTIIGAKKATSGKNKKLSGSRKNMNEAEEQTAERPLQSFNAPNQIYQFLKERTRVGGNEPTAAAPPPPVPTLSTATITHPQSNLQIYSSHSSPKSFHSPDVGSGMTGDTAAQYVQGMTNSIHWERAFHHQQQQQMAAAQTSFSAFHPPLSPNSFMVPSHPSSGNSPNNFGLMVPGQQQQPPPNSTPFMFSPTVPMVSSSSSAGAPLLLSNTSFPFQNASSQDQYPPQPMWQGGNMFPSPGFHSHAANPNNYYQHCQGGIQVYPIVPQPHQYSSNAMNTNIHRGGAMTNDYGYNTSCTTTDGLRQDDPLLMKKGGGKGGKNERKGKFQIMSNAERQKLCQLQQQQRQFQPFQGGGGMMTDSNFQCPYPPQSGPQFCFNPTHNGHHAAQMQVPQQQSMVPSQGIPGGNYESTMMMQMHPSSSMPSSMQMMHSPSTTLSNSTAQQQVIPKRAGVTMTNAGPPSSGNRRSASSSFLNAVISGGHRG